MVLSASGQYLNVVAPVQPPCMSPRPIDQFVEKNPNLTSVHLPPWLLVFPILQPISMLFPLSSCLDFVILRISSCLIILSFSTTVLLQILLFLLHLQFLFLQTLLFSLSSLCFLYPLLSFLFYCQIFFLDKKIYFHFATLFSLWNVNYLSLSLLLHKIVSFCYCCFWSYCCLWRSL